MPHSVSPDPTSSEDKDIELPDAPASPQEQDEVQHSSQISDDQTNDAPAPPNAKAPVEAKVNLESMFDDVDEEDEFNSSAPNVGSSPPAIPTIHSAKASDPEIMRAFYQRLFPYRHLFQWLNHSPSPSNDFAHREFAFTLPNDAYLRYQSFPTADLFRKQCVALTPSRFEIGPVYSTNPRDRKTLRRAAAFRPISKELVFDIDMTDYDDIRTCCTKANICNRCWSFMTMAIKVLDEALREDYGFKHILWVYSGRRGVHAWVCDKKARELDDGKRKAIANYLEVLKGGDSSGKKVNLKRPLHPHIDRSLRMLRDYFQSDILKGQDPWEEPEKAAQLLRLLPDQELAQSLSKKWESAPGRSSANKWADIDTVAGAGGASANLDTKKLLEAKQDIVLEYTYPRLDAAVSKHLNHLLKSPFCVHPGTGRICVPIDPRRADEFNPLEVPTVTELLGQIDQWKGGKEEEEDANGEAKKVPDWDKTDLKPYVDYFRGFVGGLLKDEQSSKRAREENGDAMQF